MPSPENILALLACPVCSDPLDKPTTLLCGHSVCAAHVSESCPVDGCAPESVPRIPSRSSVSVSASRQAVPTIQYSRADVSLTALLTLANRTQAQLQELPAQDDSDDDDSASTSSDTESTQDQDRPRKRHKRSHSDNLDLISHLRKSAANHRSPPPNQAVSSYDSILSQFDKKLLDELSCHICYVLFYKPVTTPCQHTFCAKCLQRSLDHNTNCPICRTELPSYYFQNQPVNKTILSLILESYPMLYQERSEAINDEERHARLNTPIFVCQLSFPGIPTLLHFFEPRYRLMLRRCLESPNPRFGMVMSPKPGIPQTDYGTMLEIRRVQMLPDGRSMVETWGSTRFRILERGTLDGYMVGRIEHIDDHPDDFSERLELSDPDPSPRTDRRLIRRITQSLTRTPPPSTNNISVSAPDLDSDDESSPPIAHTIHPHHPTNEELIQTCKAFLDRLQRGAAPWVVQRLSSTYGAMPTDIALFSFWVALVLPMEEQEKAKLLPIKSARLRLMLVVHWIEQLNNTWYAWFWFVVWFGWLGVGVPSGMGGSRRLGGWGNEPVPAPLNIVALALSRIVLWIAGLLTVFRFICWVYRWFSNGCTIL